MNSFQSVEQSNHWFFFKLVVGIAYLSIPFFIIVRDIIGLEIHKFIFILICGISFFILDFNEILCFLSYLFSMMSGLPANYILLFAYISLILKKKTRFHLLQLVLPIWILIIELLHIWEISNIDIISLASYIVHIGMISLIVFDKNENLDYRRIVIMFCIGVSVMLCLVLMITVKYTTIENMIRGKIRFGSIAHFLEGTYSMVLSNNQNNIAYYCVLAITAEITLAINKSRKFLYMVLICIHLLFGILTMSKTFLIVMFPIGIILIFANKKWSLKSCIYFLVITVMMIPVFNYGNMVGLYENIMHRFQEASFLNGRVQIFYSFSIFLYENIFYLLFGTGVLNMKEITGISSSPHCGLQQIGVAYGIFGFLLYIVGTVKMIQNANRGIKCRFIYYITLITMFLFTQSIQFIDPYELMMPTIIGFCVIRMGAENVV